jgi:hypothetical protein
MYIGIACEASNIHTWYAIGKSVEEIENEYEEAQLTYPIACTLTIKLISLKVSTADMISIKRGFLR